MGRIHRHARLFLYVLTLLTVSVPGCGSCRRDSQVENKKELADEKKEEEPKEDFQFESLVTLPTDADSTFPFGKPGHWVTARHEVTANNFDFQAELHTASSDSQGSPYAAENTRFRLSSTQPAPLPKGRKKLFETTYFVPRIAADPTVGVWLFRELRAARGGRLLKQDPFKVAIMPPYQYFFVVLAQDPDRYGYLKRLTSVATPSGDDAETDTLTYYRVVLPKIDKIAPLPSQSLSWTCIAYLLWDDVDPALLTRAQQDALLDWLHWGGQLIVSGPGTLEKLRGGFLASYLPARGTKTLEITASELERLNAQWALTERKTGRHLVLKSLPGQPLVGLELDKEPAADELPGCGRLVFEKRVGRGRVVVTAFSLTDEAILAWGCYDSFFNACLLRRPPRKFEMEEYLASTRWVDDPPASAADARLVTTLRYFSRDMGHFTSETEAPRDEPDEELATRLTQNRRLSSDAPSPAAVSIPQEARNPGGDAPHFGGYPRRLNFGMAAWNDHSGVSDAVRQSLKDAAGISIPRGSFVLQVVLVYLVVLAPLNWAFFRLLGRVEWAWVAAPVIAVVAALAIVRLAQLNIGFARSLAEIGTVEAWADYPRAHLTRYSALYTSLTTNYDLIFDDRDALAQPFAQALNTPRSPFEEPHAATLRYDRMLSLHGFQVRSNKTDIVHGEQMCQLGGAFTLLGNESEGFYVKNGTRFSLEGVGVLRGTRDGHTETAWVGELAAAMSARLAFESPDDGKPHRSEWDQSPVTLSYNVQARSILQRLDWNGNRQLESEEAGKDPGIAGEFRRLDLNSDGRWNDKELIAWCRRSRAGEVSLGQLIELAAQSLRLGPEEVRLIGWSTQEVPGVTIRPASAQVKRCTLFLVHLRPSRWPTPRPDVNRLADVLKEEKGTGPFCRNGPQGAAHKRGLSPFPFCTGP